MKTMNHTMVLNRTGRFLAFLVVFALSVSQRGFSAGTPAGTVISSRSMLVYTSRSKTVADTVYSGYVSVTILQAAAVNITPVMKNSTSSGDSTAVDYAITVTNSGNGTDNIILTPSSSKSWSSLIYSDANGDGVLQASEISAGTAGQTRSLSADAGYPIILRVLVPKGVLTGEQDTTHLLVRSNFNSSRTISGTYITTVSATNLNSFLSGLTVNNSSPKQGQNITYTMIFSNTGGYPATNVVVKDFLNANLNFLSATTTLGTLDTTANPKQWKIGTVAAGTSVTLTLTVQVSSAATAGLVVNNSMQLTYASGVINYTLTSNSVPITVFSGIVKNYNVEIKTPNPIQIREPADTALYLIKVFNTGNTKDVVELSSISTKGFMWNFFKDSNNNGILDAGDPLLSNTDGSKGIDTDSLAAGDSLAVLAIAPVPRVFVDRLKDTTTITATSSGDPLKVRSVNIITTIAVPSVTVSKSMTPAGNLPPGSEVVYTIVYSNIGSASVKNFTVVDTTPDATTYVPNSVKINSTPVNDTGGPIVITTDAFNNKIISVSIGTLAATSAGSVEFKVRIK